MLAIPDLRVRSAGVKDPKAIGLRRIPIDDLDWRPSPLPDADTWCAAELDQSAGTFDCNVGPGFSDARPDRAMQTQHIGEDGDGVVSLEGDKGRRLGQALAQGCFDAHTEWAEALGQVAQEWDRSTVVTQQGRPFGKLRLPGWSTYQDPGEARVVTHSFDDRHRRLRETDQKKKRRRAMLDELVARRRRVERPHVEFDDRAAAWREVVPQNAGASGPVDTGLGCQEDSTVARAEEEVRVELPAARLRRRQARDPFRRPFGERVENR